MGSLWNFVAQSQEPSNLIFWVDKVARTPLSKVLIFALVLSAVRLVLYPYLKNTPTHKRTGLFSFARIANETCDAFIYAAIVVFMLVRPFGIQTFHIPSGSMVETLHEGDFIVANKLVYRFNDPKVDEIAVFRPPEHAFLPGKQRSDYIKRVMGVPGDVVEIRDRVFYRNGEVIEQPFVTISTRTLNGYTIVVGEAADLEPMADFKLVKDGDRYIPLLIEGSEVNTSRLGTVEKFLIGSFEEGQRLAALPPAAIPEGYYLFMGDHRTFSSDGRMWGLVPRENIIGRSSFVMFPFGHAGKTR
ncbi:MAG: signal peptidase I [Armatimonadetes bacterium]|nr:signal peptidase I [Armatimonadota bacterium]